MTEWSDAVKARLMAYCRIDTMEDGEELLLQGLYNAAVSYMEQEIGRASCRERV